ncbi:uncharacterized protein FA14DRAFT_151418 [Meira miltonrushii]|uniref:Dol-P-Glc:Glc(2)Man(9)GlcNAc(2)-PP-Dol alpha-1,2-glucosyltransferase n=1 Tax=Meira miltonrushii TaxID=1280837 RepID=A0A316V5F2_9BASI|nr:uncharacterized protein FA14DRAFT_151418 [Meira miltonrushii]PWN31453.1 hypothetical protein FA14DRAFT_151418 [Meira miltonrushii]
MLNRSTLWSSTIALTYIAIAAIASQLVNDIVPQPYLDEIFHIPQAQQYCKGEFAKYDPKLTTPPGLYIVSLIQGQIGSLLALGTGTLNSKTCQSVSQLRQTSLFALFLLPYILASYCLATPANVTITQDRNVKVGWQRTSVPISPMEAITPNVHTISFLPPMWFFGLLYYTDVPSTLFVMAMLAASKRNENLLAALLGAISLTLRQTNIVWILFAMGTSALSNLSTIGLDTRPLSQTSVIEQLRSITSLPALTAIRILSQTAMPYIPVFGASAAFILYNGSIVLGDKEHHQVSTHWVQPFYFAAFASFFAWPTLLISLNRARRGFHLSTLRILGEIVSLALIFSIALAAVQYGTVEHPFILADNRHYAFYFWRKIIKRTDWARYALAIPYTISIRAWWIALSQHFSFFWLVGFCMCLSAAVIPSPLIEPRYFMIPFIIARLGLMQSTKPSEPTVGGSRQSLVKLNDISKPFFNACLVEMIWFALINGSTLYLFLYKPFRWPDSIDWQRFMW